MTCLFFLKYTLSLPCITGWYPSTIRSQRRKQAMGLCSLTSFSLWVPHNENRKAPSAEKILLHCLPSLIRPYHCYFVSLLDVDGVPSNRKL